MNELQFNVNSIANGLLCLVMATNEFLNPDSAGIPPHLFGRVRSGANRRNGVYLLATYFLRSDGLHT
jgi:hypothetical protein